MELKAHARRIEDTSPVLKLCGEVQEVPQKLMSIAVARDCATTSVSMCVIAVTEAFPKIGPCLTTRPIVSSVCPLSFTKIALLESEARSQHTALRTSEARS